MTAKGRGKEITRKRTQCRLRMGEKLDHMTFSSTRCRRASARFPSFLPPTPRSTSKHQSWTALGLTSIKTYSPLNMHRAYQAPTVAPQRQPLTNAAFGVNNVGPIPGSPPRQGQKLRNPSSPPLPRQNTKTTPPSPPQVIKDRGRAVEFLRIALLGEVRFSQKFIAF